MKNYYTHDIHGDLFAFLCAVNRHWCRGWTEREIRVVCKMVANHPLEFAGEVFDLVRSNPRGITMDEIFNVAENGSL